MDFLLLIFAFVNSPLFSTFMLGMFWRRTTANAAFAGLLSGTLSAALHYSLTLAEGKGGFLGTLIEYPSGMAQGFWTAIYAWAVCFLVTVVLSFLRNNSKLLKN